jgi:TonB family protein
MSLLIESVIKVSLIVLVALAVASLMRTRSASLRHWVLAAAIVCAALAPAAAPVAPAWHVAFGDRSAPPPPVARRAVPPAPVVVLSETITVTPSPKLPAPSQRPGVGRLVLATWLAGALLCLAILAIGFARLTWIASRSRPVENDAWTTQLGVIAEEFGIARPILLLQSDHPSLLVTWGTLAPAIILPIGADAWPADRIRIVLCHELAHIARGDWLVQMLAEVVRSAYWFNPLLWIASSRMRQESEHACDDAVLGAGIEGSDYAAQLVDLARAMKRQRHPWVPAQAIVRPSNLERRVSAMLNAEINRRPITRVGRLAAAVALAGVTLLVAGFGAAQTLSIVSGTIVDPLAKPLANATLTLTNVQTDAKHEVHSDQAGRFEFVGLPSGEYTLQAEFIGFATMKEPVALAGENVRRSLTMQVGTIHETITIKFDASEASTAPPPPPAPGISPPSWDEFRDRVRAKRASDPCAQSPDGGCLMPPLKLKDVKARFPDSLKGTKIDGVVLLRGAIGTDGYVHNLQVVSSPHPDLSASAIEAVSQWQFAATQLDGVPIETAINVTVNFSGR